MKRSRELLIDCRDARDRRASDSVWAFSQKVCPTLDGLSRFASKTRACDARRIPARSHSASHRPRKQQCSVSCRPALTPCAPRFSTAPRSPCRRCVIPGRLARAKRDIRRGGWFFSRAREIGSSTGRGSLACPGDGERFAGRASRARARTPERAAPPERLPRARRPARRPESRGSIAHAPARRRGPSSPTSTHDGRSTRAVSLTSSPSACALRHDAIAFASRAHSSRSPRSRSPPLGARTAPGT